jgi:hypothetical protein
MTETMDDYKKRLLGYVQGRNPMEVIEMTVPRIEALVSSASAEKLQKKEDGKWSAAEILAHYAEGEMVTSNRLRMVLAVNGTDIQAYDQNLWVGNARYLIEKPELALEVFKVLRNANIALLQSLNKEQWQNYGIHSERGKESVTDMVRMISGHDLNHLSQFERLMKS